MEMNSVPLNIEEKEISPQISPRLVLLMESVLILVFTVFPLLFDLPFRDNLYLSWEGTYRLYLGQLPYKDFGMPIGYGYFIIPLLFFKLFGPFLRTLLYAQVFINFLSILFFRGILRELGLNQVQKLLSVLVFTVSYTFIFFWPWYNNTALFYQLVGIYLILLIKDSKEFKYYYLIAGAAISTFLSFFTKQDYGGLAFLFSLILITYDAIIYKDIKRAVLFVVLYGVTAIAFILPFVNEGFLYWFNYGQAPHQSRLNPAQFLNEIFGSSAWEKFYLFMIVLLAIDRIKNFKEFINNRNEILLFLICAGMVMEALITKVTSRLPSDTTTYFHGFAFAYIISHIPLRNYSRNIYLVVASISLVVIWWSAMYWKYANRMFHFAQEDKSEKKVAVVNNSAWKKTPFKVYRNIHLPESTIDGVKRIQGLDVVKSKGKSLRVLNMSELTPLAYELSYTPQKSLPLWYHFNIGMFQKQVDDISGKIKNNHYDLVLFEEVPGLENFYPEEIRMKLKMHYVQVDSFMAPRKDGDSHIEVFIRKK